MRWIVGSILIMIGTIYLGDTLSIWSVEDFAQIWKFWPILLILFGVSIFIRHLKSKNLILFIMFVLSLLLVFSSLVYGKPTKISSDYSVTDVNVLAKENCSLNF